MGHENCYETGVCERFCNNSLRNRLYPEHYANYADGRNVTYQDDKGTSKGSETCIKATPAASRFTHYSG